MYINILYMYCSIFIVLHSKYIFVYIVIIYIYVYYICTCIYCNIETLNSAANLSFKYSSQSSREKWSKIATKAKYGLCCNFIYVV